MGKKILAVFLICPLAIILPGCWDYKDLDDLAIPITGIYDLAKAPKEDQDYYTVGAIFPVLYPDTEKKYIVQFTNGRTVVESREERNSRSPEIYSVGMVRSAIFGEELAKKGLLFPSDNLFRVTELRSTIYLSLMEGEVESLAQLEMKDYPNAGTYLLGLLKTAQANSFLPTSTLQEFAVQCVTTGKNPILPIVKIKDNSSLAITGTGIFKKDKLIAKVGLKDTRSLVMLRGLEGLGIIPYTIEQNGEKIDEGTMVAKRSRKVKVIRNGDNFTFYITIKLTGELSEHSSRKAIIDSKNTMPLSQIEQAVKNEVQKDCREFIKKMQEEFKIDCIDVTKYALSKWRKELKDKAEEGFIEKANIVVDVDVKIKDIGELT